MTTNLLSRFIDSQKYDIRVSRNGRWIDQKCAFDAVCFVADCIVEYIRNGGEQPFTSPQIWKSEYAIKNVQMWFGKPDPLKRSTSDEYNKFFRQPMKLLAASKILSEDERGNAIDFKVERMEILEFIALRERNSFDFLCLYIEKTLKDSGLWDSFESFLDEQSQSGLQDLKIIFKDFCIRYTPINNVDETYRIFSKVLNPLAIKYSRKGVIKGRISPFIITFNKIMYNQPNWRDVGKEKNVARGDFDTVQETELIYQYKISRAAKNLRNFNDKYNAGRSEITDKFSVGQIATHMHHIFPKSQFRQIADYIENIIALTSGQHLQMAHPNGNTSVINKDYQYVCLVNKTDSIRRNILSDPTEPKIYNFNDFMHVLNVGFKTDYFANLQLHDFNSVLMGIEINYP